MAEEFELTGQVDAAQRVNIRARNRVANTGTGRKKRAGIFDHVHMRVIGERRGPGVHASHNSSGSLAITLARAEWLYTKGSKKSQDYYMRERTFGSFQRSFQPPADVDTDKIEAGFKKGVLTVTLPKSAEAQKSEKKITVKFT